jgi:hypothetical protein
MKASDSILWVIPARPLSCICSASSLLFSVVEGRDPGFTGTKTCDVCLRLRSSRSSFNVQLHQQTIPISRFTLPRHTHLSPLAIPISQP